MVPTTDSSSHLASKSYLVFELGHKMGNSSPLSSSLHSARNRGWDLLKRKFSIHRIHHDRSVIFHFTYPFSFFSCLGGFVYFFFFFTFSFLSFLFFLSVPPSNLSGGVHQNFLSWPMAGARRVRSMALDPERL